MSGFKDKGFSDRLSTAADAKKALLDKFRANKPTPDDPAVLARQAERKAIAEAREVRAAERALAKKAEDERRAVEAAERELADQARAEQEKLDEVARVAAAKAARDARYAARKARKR